MASKVSDQNDTIADINIVPLVDIILVVLIIFMVTAPNVVKPNLEVDLPEASSSDAESSSTFQLVVTSDERVLLEGQEVTKDEIISAARSEFEKNPEIQAVIASDQEVAYGVVVQVMDWVKSGGIKKLAVSTDKPL